jgi:ATP adenylyltransferase
MKTKSSKLSGLSQELVPLFRPERSKYVRNNKVEKDCVFCSAARSKKSFKSLCVFKTKYSIILLNKYPYNAGHILIVPKNHKEKLSDLSETEYLDLMNTLRVSEVIINKIYNPSGINIGLNQGAAAGAGIPDHLHFHLIPRWRGDLNFFPLVAKSKVIIETLEESYLKILAAFTKYKS